MLKKTDCMSVKYLEYSSFS